MIGGDFYVRVNGVVKLRFDADVGGTGKSS